MKKWELSLYAFREDCAKNEQTSQINNTLYLQKIEEHFEKQLTNLVDIGKGLYEEFEKIELKNREIEAKVDNLYKVNKTTSNSTQIQKRMKSLVIQQTENEENKGPQTPKVVESKTIQP